MQLATKIWWKIIYDKLMGLTLKENFSAILTALLSMFATNG